MWNNLLLLCLTFLALVSWWKSGSGEHKKNIVSCNIFIIIIIIIIINYSFGFSLSILMQSLHHYYHYRPFFLRNALLCVCGLPFKVHPAYQYKKGNGLSRKYENYILGWLNASLKSKESRNELSTILYLQSK